MKRWKEIGIKLLYPPVWLIILLTILSTVSLISVFVGGMEESVVSYIVYVVSFYTLTVVTFLCIKVLPGIFSNAKTKVYGNKYANRYITDVVFKTHVSLYLSLTANLIYAGINLLYVFIYKSAWFSILTGYYVILAVMRFLLVRYVRVNEIGENYIYELKRSRICAFLTLTVNLVLSGAVLMMIYQNRGYEYNGILIYIMAIYTFYVTTHSVINLIKYRKLGSPVMSMSKVINLSAALVSVINLETAMLTAFGSDNLPEFRRIMIALTGLGVSIIVVAMSVYMIIKSTNEINKNRGIKNGK